MNTRALLNLALLLGVAALALFVYLDPGGKQAPEGKPLLACSAEAIHTLRVERPDGEPVTLTRGDGGWAVTAPFSARANRFRVHSLLALCTTPSLSRFAASALNLKEVGLEPPRARLTMDGQTLLFGGTEALDQRRYVQVGETVHLVDEDAYRHLIADPAAFADPALLPPEAHIEALKLPKLTLTRTPDGWQVKGAKPASQDAPQMLADHWAAAHGLTVTRAEKLPKGASAEVQLADLPKPIRFVVEQDDRELRLTRADNRLTYHLPAASAADLLQLPSP